MLNKDAIRKVRFYKIVSDKGKAVHGGCFTYDLPKDGKPGKWTPFIRKLSMCHQGYHVAHATKIRSWDGWGANHRHVYLVEARNVRGNIFDSKVVCSSIRLVRRVSWSRTFANAEAEQWQQRGLYNRRGIVANCRELDKILVGSVRK